MASIELWSLKVHNISREMSSRILSRSTLSFFVKKKLRVEGKEARRNYQNSSL